MRHFDPICQHRHQPWLGTLALSLLLAACSTPEATTPAESAPAHAPSAEATLAVAEDTPRLVLFLVIDQARYDYLERFRPLLQGGLARLLEEGVDFTDAHHAHAMTATGPGHATLATGTHPAQHGVIGNSWIDRTNGDHVYCAEDANETPSPAQLLRPTLGDRMKAAWPSTKSFTAAGKDRAAILTAGHQADAAFWYDDDSDGRFVTSEAYLTVSPEWLNDFHARRLPDAAFGRLWQPLPAVEQALLDESYGVTPLQRAPIERQFPHALGSPAVGPSGSFYSDFIASPFMDTYLVDFALALIDGEQLGQDEVPDFLGLGFSPLDYIGHDYGPDSPEVLDTLLRLDQQLGRLFDEIDQRIGLDATLISLSSDHGVGPIPEVARQRGNAEARRLGSQDVLCYQQAGLTLAATLGTTPSELFWSGLYFDPRTLENLGKSIGSARAELQSLLGQCDGVVRSWTYDQLVAGGMPGVPLSEAYVHGFHPERSADVLLQLGEHVLYSLSSETSHASPYPHDSHVPWLLRLPAPVARQIDTRVHTVDVVPTLAVLLGLPTDGMDGQDRGPFE